MIWINQFHLTSAQPRVAQARLLDDAFDVSAKQSPAHSALAGRPGRADSHHVWVSIYLQETCRYFQRVHRLLCSGCLGFSRRYIRLPSCENMGMVIDTARRCRWALRTSHFGFSVFLHIFVRVRHFWRLSLIHVAV
jgi:hypothetical protein